MEMLIYLCVAERKIDSYFPNGQFFLQGYYSPYCLNASNRMGWVISLCKRAYSDTTFFFLGREPDPPSSESIVSTTIEI